MATYKIEDIAPAYIERFWSKVDKKGEFDCWVWNGPRERCGYGVSWAGKPGGTMIAHRFALLTEMGELPRDLVVDHICRNRACCNPKHLRVITSRENVLIGVGPSAVNARKTHCRKGHEFTDENTLRIRGSSRACKACQRQAEAEYKQRRRAKNSPVNSPEPIL